MLPNTALSPIRRKSSLTGEVVERLRKAILSGELAEGTPLPEAQTSQKLDVSRVPVREALVELERQGLVAFDRNGRACVRAFDASDIQEILSLRAALQTMAARLAAARFTDQDRSRLEDILSRAEGTHELTPFSALDAAFHDEVVAIAGNSRLLRVWNDLRAQMELWLSRLHRERESTRHDVREATLRSHREMLEVLATRRPEAAGALMERHCSWVDHFPQGK
jgi:DNA-binding GntR family transcriptional regulator